MKDALQSPFWQALACLLVAAGLYTLAGRAAGDAHDGLIALAGVAATLWARLPQKTKSDSGPASGALALLLACGLVFGSSSACAPTTRQVQLNVAEVATQAANEVGQAILQRYEAQLGQCVADATHEMEYTICKMAADQVWGPVRLKYASLRRVQDEYATALEKNELRRDDFALWFRVAYCELRSSAPPELVLPPAVGIECGEDGAQ